MRVLYSLLFYLALPLVLLRLLWKSRKQKAYRQRLGERFGLVRPKQPVDIWLHAVSLGEVIAAGPLVERLLAQGYSLMLTSITVTGSAQIQKQFGHRVQHQYLPYDLPLFLVPFFKRLQPKLLIIMETEIWPNVIQQAWQRKIPLIVANARISETAFPAYLRAKRFFKPVLGQITQILAQSPIDQTRFLALGASNEQLRVLGNLKFDLEPTKDRGNSFLELKQCWGETRPVLIVASSHDPEEHLILAELGYWQSKIPGLLLLIAPRHPDRFQCVYQLAIQQGFACCLRSKPEELSAKTEVLVIDSLGELNRFYALADFAFVGGSLKNIGGHNVLEPIASGIPVLTGPYMQNSASIVASLVAAKAMIKTRSVTELGAALIGLYENPAQAQAQIAAAKEVLNSNRGALEAHLGIISRYLRE